MKQLSNAFIQALNNDERNYLAYADITLYDGTELSLTNAEIWMGGFQYEEAVSNDDSFTALGSAIMGSATLIINNIYDDYSEYSFANAEVVLYVGIVSASDKLRLGTYRVDAATYNGATIQLTLLDAMERFDKPYSLSTLTYPATLVQIISDACTVCEVSLETSNFPNSSFTISTRPTDEAITFRDVISWVGTIAGCFLKCTSVGSLKLQWFNETALEAIDIDDPNFHPWEDEELYSSSGVHYLYSLNSQNISVDDVVITGVSADVKTEDEDVESGVISYSVGQAGYMITLDDNAFITTSNAQTIVNNLGEQLIGLRFRKLSITQESNPAIEAGDVAIVRDRKGNLYKILITRNAFAIGTPQTIVCGADTPLRNSSTQFSSSTKGYVDSRKLFRKEYVAIGAVQESITAINGNITNLQADTAKIHDLTADQLSATVGYIEDLTAGNISASDITADHATITNLDSTYAHITNGVIDNATISYADIDDLDANYAHITQGVIDNATIGYADVDGLNANYAHITNGFIDNADIKEADVENLTTKYAHITNGFIDNADIKEANVENLTSKYAHITQGVIDNAKIGYADVNGLNAHYAEIDMANVNNAWIENGVVKDAAISDAQIIGVSANKLTAGTIDANNINVANLRAKNLIVEKMNGQPILGGYELVNKNSTGYSGKNPSTEGWYEYSNGTFTASTDTTVDMSKAYYKDGNSVALYDQTYIDGLENNLQQQIDGAVQTYTGTAVPTLVNYPAVDWTSAQMANHVGDIYYVVNAGNDYDGYSYRFSYDNSTSTYSWRLIRDSGVTAALSRLQTAEGDITNLKSFESDTTGWITETDEEISSLKSRTTTLETGLDDAIVDVKTLWYTKANNSAPSPPNTKVEDYKYVLDKDGNNIVDKNGNAFIMSEAGSNIWTVSVPTYSADTPHYFYCFQYEYADGTVAWSEVVYDIATSENQANARNALAIVDTKVSTTVFNEVKQTVDENSATITSLSEVVETKADGSTVDTLSNTVNVISQTTDTNSSTISNLTTVLGTNADGSTKEGDIAHRASSLEQDLDGFKTTVSSTYQTKSDMSNYSTTTQMNSAINQKANEISSAVSQTYATIASVPTNVSDLNNDSNFATESYADGVASDAETNAKTDADKKFKANFATSSTVAGTAAKVATITPEVTGWSLYNGATIVVKFINANTTSAPTLNINSTGAKSIKTYSGGNLSADEYKWVAGATMTFTYDGANWRIQDSSELVRLKSAESSITQTADSIISLVANTDTYTKPDGTTATNTIKSAIKQNSDNIALRVEKSGVISAINLSSESAKIQASKVEIDGTAIFNAISSDVDDAITDKGYQTSSQVESAITGKGYQTSSQVESAITSKGYQTSSQVSTAIANGITGKADKTSAISRSQRIYWRAKTASGKPSINTTWLATSGTGYGNWSLSIPQLTSGTEKYPFLYTAVQTQTVSQQAAGSTCSCSDVLLDDTTTVIDGGTIITNSIHANAVTSAYGAFDTALIPDLSADKILAGTLTIGKVDGLNDALSNKANSSDVYDLSIITTYSASTITFLASLYMEGEDATTNYEATNYQWYYKSNDELEYIGSGYSITVNKADINYGKTIYLDFTKTDYLYGLDKDGNQILDGSGNIILYKTEVA